MATPTKSEVFHVEQLPGLQRNPARCATARQIANDVIGCLAELAADVPKLRGPCDELRTAYLLNKPMPTGLLSDEWLDIESVAIYVFEVRDALRAGDKASAWRAAAGATFRYRDAEDRLRHERTKQEEETAAAEQLAAAQKEGAKANAAQRDSRRQQAIEIYLTGNWKSKDAAAHAMADKNGFGRFSTVRGYLRGVDSSGKNFSGHHSTSETIGSPETVSRTPIS